MTTALTVPDVESFAHRSRSSSAKAKYRAVAKVLIERHYSVGPFARHGKAASVNPEPLVPTGFFG